VIKLRAEQQVLPRAELLVGAELNAVGVGPLVLVIDRGERVSAPALVHALLPLRVERVDGGEAVEPAELHPVVLHVEEVEHQVPQVGYQVPVAP
jgi:hypothetical protein